MYTIPAPPISKIAFGPECHMIRAINSHAPHRDKIRKISQIRGQKSTAPAERFSKDFQQLFSKDFERSDPISKIAFGPECPMIRAINSHAPHRDKIRKISQIRGQKKDRASPIVHCTLYIVHLIVPYPRHPRLKGLPLRGVARWGKASPSCGPRRCCRLRG